jgi:hypothetical protein
MIWDKPPKSGGRVRKSAGKRHCLAPGSLFAGFTRRIPCFVPNPARAPAMIGYW